MSVNHTPGPWTLETVKTSCGICHKIGPFPPRRDSEEPGAACIYVDYYSPGNPRHEELKANAELIRSAPELAAQLAALKEENERLMRLHANTCIKAGDEITTLKARVAELEQRLENIFFEDLEEPANEG